jgi:leucyl-tRNA synthetase
MVKNDEPAERLFTQGMVIKDGAKMSKSKGNVVSPDDMIARYGADATRMYALFAAPPDRDLEWQEEGVAGISRFLSRVYIIVTSYAKDGFSAHHELDRQNLWKYEKEALRKLNQTVRKITDDFQGRWHFNTSIAALMELVNALPLAVVPQVLPDGNINHMKLDSYVRKEVATKLTLLMAPFAPFFAAEMWEQIGGEGVVFRTQWPVVNEELAREDEIEIPVQVNGKLVNVVKVPAGSDEAVVRAAALADMKVMARIDGKTVVKVIVVPGKLVNLVVK